MLIHVCRLYFFTFHCPIYLKKKKKSSLVIRESLPVVADGTYQMINTSPEALVSHLATSASEPLALYIMAVNIRVTFLALVPCTHVCICLFVATEVHVHV